VTNLEVVGKSRMTSREEDKLMTSQEYKLMTSQEEDKLMTSQEEHKLLTSQEEKSEDCQMSFSDLSKELQTELKDLIRWSKSTPEDFESVFNNFQTV
jgi:hypothetical protein